MESDEPNLSPSGGRCPAIAGWFGSQSQPAFGWLHFPATGVARGGLVLCPPLFLEYLPTHGSYRMLAEQVAGRGLAALRFDWRGTGDSSGSPASCSGVQAWLDDIAAAVDILRSSGAPWISVVGMRGSAVLASRFAERANADALVLWDPPVSGRAVIRENKLLFDAMLGGAYPKRRAEHYTSPPEPVPGWDYSNAFAQELAAQTFASWPPVDTEVLVMARSGKVSGTLGGWVREPRVEVDVADGQTTLLDRGVIHSATLQRLVSWIDDHAPGTQRRFDAHLRDQAILRSAGASIRERPMSVTPHALFALVSEPLGEPRGPAVVLFNSGSQHHVGPSRFYVDLARELAADGLRCLRVDLKGLGDSPGRFVTQPDLVYPLEALEDVLAVAVAASPDDPSNVVFVGLCSGGYHSIEAALRVRARGVCVVHTDLDFDGDERQRPFGHPNRLAWVRDSPLVSLLGRSRLTERVRWHLPTGVWWLLDVLGIQDDIARGVEALAEQGTDTLFVAERWRVKRPRLWNLRKLGRQGRVRLVSVTDYDHSLQGLDDRQRAITSVESHILGLADPPLGRHLEQRGLAQVREASGGNGRAKSAPSRRDGLVRRSRELAVHGLHPKPTRSPPLAPRVWGGRPAR